MGRVRPGAAEPKIRYAMENGIDLDKLDLRMPCRPGEMKRVRDLAAVCLGPGETSLDLNGIDTKNKDLRYAVCPVFRRSNEGYSAGLRSAIGGLTGIDEYVGVCGGGDQHPFLLGLLQRNNGLRRATLVDYDVGQLLNFREIAELFNSRDGDGYVSAIDSVDLSAWADRRDERNGWRYRKPELREGLEICGVLYDIVEYLPRIRERGAYFIYLSNVLFSHAPLERSAQALEAVLKSEDIDRGSAVTLVQMRPSACILLRKESKDAFGVVFSEKEELAQGSEVCVEDICRAMRRR